ncbi:hypothetical protein SUGI_0410640 [Cryptomeria japonica]|uniref:gibberellin 20-oxidase-like protein n=1 Tax=Cryptomeria japonica TaxID=3369 RepID=UPI002408C43D|nr:gibberellin 20-oxidase-like protein [Cryptomeria japonica]GLJ21933.1 hypothetical protein SUGI_0410640 [Cryptomeria japonica]
MASDLPVIDLSLLPSNFGEKQNFSDLDGNNELKKLREACQELGFFRIINHGMEAAFIQKTDSLARDMFSLAEEEKSRAIFPIFNTGYCPADAGADGKASLPENLVFPGENALPNSVDQISAKLWPHGNNDFQQTVHKYNSHMTEVAHRILKLVLLSLGLDVSKHYNSDPFGTSLQGWLRMNYYYNTKDEEEEAQNVQHISKAHTDLGCVTILYQDNVGGLQIRTKKGDWINTKPLPGAFVVNLGDCLQMWSNCRYRSSEHRVVYQGLKKNQGRLSMAFFLDFIDKAEIRAPKELIDEEHPQKYKTVKFSDITSYLMQVGPTLGGPPSYFLL